jgi:hypothetical protein
MKIKIQAHFFSDNQFMLSLHCNHNKNIFIKPHSETWIAEISYPFPYLRDSKYTLKEDKGHSHNSNGEHKRYFCNQHENKILYQQHI